MAQPPESEEMVTICSPFRRANSKGAQAKRKPKLRPATIKFIKAYNLLDKNYNQAMQELNALGWQVDSWTLKNGKWILEKL